MTRHVLVTGASGRIGSHVVRELLARGCRVRALTSKALDAGHEGPVDWRTHDWAQSIDFAPHVAGCDAVLHLGAEIWDIPRMQRINVEATRALAQAAEEAGVRFFGYTSSIAAYGSAKTAVVTEASPVLTTGRDVRSEYRANPSLRAYGRTKLLGEQAIRAIARDVDYAIFRPTVVIDLPEIAALSQLGGAHKFVVGNRLTQHVYVRDVADAMIWFMERSLLRDGARAGVEVYNLSDDDPDLARFRDVFAFALARTGDPGFRARANAPLFLYDLADMLKARTLSLRRSLGRTFFSPAKLRATGYRFPFGVRKAYELAFPAQSRT